MYIYAGNLRVAKVSGGAIYYFHKDHLGSSTMMTDKYGTVVEGTEYMPFGSQREHLGTDVSAYKFTDQELDATTGFYNYDARLYDPVIGRFISADSVKPKWYDPQNLNRYAYCLNNPIKYHDPSGNFAITGSVALGFAIAKLGAVLGSWGVLSITAHAVDKINDSNPNNAKSASSGVNEAMKTVTEINAIECLAVYGAEVAVHESIYGAVNLATGAVVPSPPQSNTQNKGLLIGWSISKLFDDLMTRLNDKKTEKEKTRKDSDELSENEANSNKDNKEAESPNSDGSDSGTEDPDPVGE